MLAIGHALATRRDISHLCQASRHFHRLLNPVLYAVDASHETPRALLWAADKTQLPTARFALAAGADSSGVFPQIFGGTDASNPLWSIITFPKHASQIIDIHLRVSERIELVRFLLDCRVPLDLHAIDVLTIVALSMHGEALLDQLQQRVREMGMEEPAAMWSSRYPLDHAVVYGSPEKLDHILRGFEARGISMDGILTDLAVARCILRAPGRLAASVIARGFVPTYVLRRSINETGFEMAIAEGSVAKVKAFTERGDVAWNRESSVNGRTPFHRAVVQGRAEIIELLLAQPQIDPNLLDKNGDTAYVLGYPLIGRPAFRLLVASPKIDLAQKREQARRVVERALQCHDADTVALLLEHGAAGDDYVWILFKAIEWECLDAMDVLVTKYNVSVNAKNQLGNRPLEFAFRNSKTLAAKKLVDLGAKDAEDEHAGEEGVAGDSPVQCPGPADDAVH